MTDPSSQVTGATQSTSKKSNVIGFLIGALIIVFGALMGYQLFFDKSSEPATISGQLNFNGLKPADQPNRAVSIRLMQRVRGETEFVETGINIPVADEATWSWSSALSGTTYELRADGYFGNEMITTSNTIVATAPATDLTLTFNVTTDDLPEELRPTPDPEEPEAVVPATVSGTIIINGFLPQGSTVTIFGRPTGSENEFKPALEDLPARSGMTWSFSQAQAGVTYDYQAELYNSAGALIGESVYLTVTAPAANERLTINSTATQPAVPATISGTVTLQGPVQQNTTILVLQRVVGAVDFTVIDRYPATNNTKWSWANAVTGTRYEVTAALQVNEQNIASGETITVAAPASDINIIINTGVNLTTPTQLVRVECGAPDATNHYNARISIPQYPDAKLYYLEIGTAAGSSNVFSHTVQPNQVTTVYIPGNSPHFSRFSYSACTDCNLRDTGNWAGWSPTYGFVCETQGAQTLPAPM